MKCCGPTLLSLQSRGLWHRQLNIGPRRLRGRRNSLIPPYKKGRTRSVSGAQTHSHLPPTDHTEMVQMLLVVDSMRHTLSGKKSPTTRWEIDASETHEKWTTNTLTRWLNNVTSAMREHPLKGFSSTSYSLRKGHIDSRL
jgi:hypothetical protein